jgi:hypothetical protein
MKIITITAYILAAIAGVGMLACIAIKVIQIIHVVS